MSSDALTIQPIGIIHSGFKEKFGIPRQPGLASSMTATIELSAPYDNREAVRGLEQCSHIWLLFIFSACVDKGWSPTVRPPRLGGNDRLGVFASRSPFRPNPVGLSPVKLEAIRFDNGKVLLDVSGADLLDQTPIIDIKPYLPYADILPEAEFELATGIERLELPLQYSTQAQQSLQQHMQRLALPLDLQIDEVLQCDPRPAYHKGKISDREYGVRLHDLNIRWQVCSDHIYVTTITLSDDA
ncbi:tRNA (N6-threonylcarbamoyladenosine(37)-N6)-methyltransferase TrmO [Amphritea sp. HPY]|uniref:tRNA (N6-threonylcarbamoyladenosine(37)-N6)-methyltransferase TrmO n=1 Tax=Amphritea sp. HPY TaxID=3421652 RepID=UPI003D7EBB14